MGCVRPSSESPPRSLGDETLMPSERILRPRAHSEKCGVYCGSAHLAWRIIPINQWLIASSGGWGGIRTHGTVARTPVFKTGALNHSATHPLEQIRHLADQAPSRSAWPEIGVRLAPLYHRSLRVRNAGPMCIPAARPRMSAGGLRSTGKPAKLAR